MRKFTKDHEWIEVDGDTGTVGITDYAQNQLGDVVFVELPEVGRNVSQSDETAVVESVKAASEVYTPVSGEIIEINEDLQSQPELVNQDAMENGWFFKIKLTAPDELEGLMDENTYKEEAGA